jgi:hypothetical protein
VQWNVWNVFAITVKNGDLYSLKVVRVVTCVGELQLGTSLWWAGKLMDASKDSNPRTIYVHVYYRTLSPPLVPTVGHINPVGTLTSYLRFILILLYLGLGVRSAFFALRLLTTNGHFSSPQNVPHALPISFFIWSPVYLVKSWTSEASRLSVSFSMQLGCLPEAQTSISAPWFQTPSVSISPSMSETKFHTHSKHRDAIWNDYNFVWFIGRYGGEEKCT